MFSKELYNKFRYLLSKKRSFFDICRELNLKDSEAMMLIDSLKDSNVYIQLFGEDYIKSKMPPINEDIYYIYLDKDHIKLMLLGDTHLCHKNDRIDIITEAYYIAEKENVDIALHCGDFFDGLNPNIEDYDKVLKDNTYDGQKEYGILYYPRYSNRTFVVSGNHDNYWYQLTGKEILKEVSEKRNDIVYLGNNRRKLSINGLRLDLVHGDRLQNGIPNFKAGYYLRASDEERPDILHYGHLHKPTYNIIYDTRCYRTSSLMNTTAHEKGNGYSNKKVVYLVDIYYGENRKVKKIKHKQETLDK